MAADYIRKANQEIPLNSDQIMEMARLMRRPTGVRRLIHYVDINTADGPQRFSKVIKSFQWEMIDLLQENDRSILLASRQMSKCVVADSLITVRNDISGEIMELTIGEFHSMMSKEKNS